MSRLVFLSEQYVIDIITPAVVGPDAVLARPMGLRSAIGRQAASFGGFELYEGLPAKAAALLEGILRNHPFVDGNKRVAAASALILLELNNQPSHATEDEVVDLTAAAAGGNVSLDAIAAEIVKWTS